MDRVEHLVASILNGLHEPAPFTINSFNVDSIDLRHQQATRLIDIDGAVGHGDGRAVLEQLKLNDAAEWSIDKQLIVEDSDCKELLLHHLVVEYCAHFFHS